MIKYLASHDPVHKWLNSLVHQIEPWCSVSALQDDGQWRLQWHFGKTLVTCGSGDNRAQQDRRGQVEERHKDSPREKGSDANI